MCAVTMEQYGRQSTFVVPGVVLGHPIAGKAGARRKVLAIENDGNVQDAWLPDVVVSLVGATQGIRGGG